MKTLNIVIPMKGLSQSKQRLRHVLNVQQRETLSLTLFRNTLTFFAEHYPQYNLLVVTDNANIERIAMRLEACVYRETQCDGLNAALTKATQWSEQHGFTHQLIVPADIGKLNKQELDQVIATGLQQAEVVIATAKDLGTNALMTSPPSAIPFAYGLQSSAKHAQLAHQANRRLEVLSLNDLSQDIDNPSDILDWYQQSPITEYCYE